MLTQTLPRGIYILFLLGADNGASIRGRTRLEKMVFLLSKEILTQPGRKITPREYTFRADRFGPFSEEVYDDVETLSDLDLVEWDNNHEILKISSKGLQLLNKLKKSEAIPYSLKNDIENLKRKYGNMKLERILNYVYRNYDKYTYESEIRDKILG